MGTTRRKELRQRQANEPGLDGLARRINEKHKAVEAKTRESLLKAREAGKLLNQAKGRVAHGEFMAWVKERCRFSHAIANLYMKFADPDNWQVITQYMESNSEPVTNLTLRGAAELLRKPPRPWKQPGGEGEPESRPSLVVAQCRDAIRRFSAALRRAQESLDRLRPHAEQLLPELARIREPLAQLEADLKKSVEVAA